jgi:Zn-dependent protease
VSIGAVCQSSARLSNQHIFEVIQRPGERLHGFGHILSGKLVHSAMDELLITATRDVNLYHGDQRLIPGHVHLVRSLGGPLFNIFVAGVCIMLATVVAPGFWLNLVTSLVSTNLFFGLGGLLPLPSVDGEVIWRELLRPIYGRLKRSSDSHGSDRKSSQSRTPHDNE